MAQPSGVLAPRSTATQDEGERAAIEAALDKDVLLFGFNIVAHVTLWGKTNEIVIAFRDPSNRLKYPIDLTVPGGNLEVDFPDLPRWISSGMHSLAFRRVLSHIAKQTNDREGTELPLGSQRHYHCIVVEKQAEFVEIKNERALVHGYLILADKSGIVACKMMNDSVAAVHRTINIGDEIVFTTGFVKFHDGYLSQRLNSSILNVEATDLEIRFHPYHHEQIHIVKRGVSIPLHLFRPGNRPIAGTFNFFTTQQIVKKHLENVEMEAVDLIGVICTVTKIHRIKKYEAPIQFTNNEILLLNQYSGYRIIRLMDVDKDLKNSIDVKLFLNFDNFLNARERFQRGNVLLMTNLGGWKMSGGICANGIFNPVSLSSSVFTKVYVGEEMEKYSQIRPDEYQTKINDFNKSLAQLGEKTTTAVPTPSTSTAPLEDSNIENRPTVSDAPNSDISPPIPQNIHSQNTEELRVPISLNPRVIERECNHIARHKSTLNI